MLVKEVPDHAPDRPARAHQQYAFSDDLHTVGAEIPHQSRAVGGIAVSPAVRVKADQVGGPRPVRPGAAAGDIFPGLFLERQGDVQSQAARPAERLDVGGEFAGMGEYGAIGQFLAGLLSEQPVDTRGEAVCYGVADDGIAVHCDIVSQDNFRTPI